MNIRVAKRELVISSGAFGARLLLTLLDRHVYLFEERAVA